MIAYTNESSVSKSNKNSPSRNNESLNKGMNTVELSRMKILQKVNSFKSKLSLADTNSKPGYIEPYKSSSSLYKSDTISNINQSMKNTESK